MKPLNELSIVVTGGGSGIGEALARYYATGGAHVTICGRRGDAIQRVADELGELCHAIEADVTDEHDRQRLLQEAINHGGKIDALVSNAGNMYRASVSELEENRILELFNTNVVAGMMLTRLFRKALGQAGGAVIFIGSVHNKRAFPGASPYAATKGALESLTKVFAAELGADGIRVNCFVPGAVPTQINQRAGLLTDEEAVARLRSMSSMHALGRIGTATEIAEAIDYLIRAEWTTGAVLDVDGGLGLGLSDLDP